MKFKSIFVSSLCISLFLNTCSLFSSFASSESRSKKTTKKEMEFKSLDLKNVYLTAFISSPESIAIVFGDDDLGNVYENNGLIFFGDSVISRQWTYRGTEVDSVIEVYKVPDMYLSNIKELSTHVLNNKANWNSSDAWAYKLFGCMTFYPAGKYPESMTPYNSPGGTVDSLYQTIMNLSSDTQALSTPKLLYNTKIIIANKERKTKEFACLTLQINGKLLQFENNKIHLKYLYNRSIPAFNLTENEINYIHSLFKDNLPIVYTNHVDNVIYTEAPTNLLLFLDNKIVFFDLFTFGRTIDLNNESFIPTDEYWLRIYELWKIAKKYYPDIFKEEFILNADNTLRIK